MDPPVRRILVECLERRLYVMLRALRAALTKNPVFQVFFHGKMHEPDLRYTEGTLITIARFVQTEQCGWAKYVLFGWNGRRNKELPGWSSSPKAVGSIKRAELPAVFSIHSASSSVGGTMVYDRALRTRATRFGSVRSRVQMFPPEL